MDCPYCKQRISDIVSSHTPQENFVRLVKECCGNCGGGCGNNQVFHPDYSTHTQQVWMEAVRWAANQLAIFSMKADRLECQKNALQQVNADLEQQVANLEEYVTKGVAFRDELQAEIARLKEIEKRAGGVEGLAILLCELNCVSTGTRISKEYWAKVPEPIKEIWRNQARAVSAYLLKKEG